MATKRSATFLGPSKGLTIIGEHCYAYSGEVTDSGSSSAATTLLDFATGANLIIAKFNWVSSVNANIDIYLDVTFNGQSVYKGTSDESPSFNADREFTLAIPPNTHVIWKMGFNSAKNMCGVITGKVYDNKDL